jgi:cytochrome P450
VSNLQRQARRRDRTVYLRSHPLLFLLLALLRRQPIRRIGRTVVVNDSDAFRQVLTTLPLDRLAPRTTGAVARELTGGELLFDQDGSDHRLARRALSETLGGAGVATLRPVWLAVLDRRLAPLAAGDDVDLVELAAELSGATTAAMLAIDVDGLTLATAARAAAAGAVAAHLKGRRPSPLATAEAARLAQLLGSPAEDSAKSIMLVLAAVNTTVAAMPRAVAWCADAGMWPDAADDERRPVLVTELLRITAASPVLPRSAAAGALVAGTSVRRGDRLVLVARHAAGAHRRDPDVDEPAPEQVSRLVFGAGAHTCPGALLARAQLEDVLRALAPFRPRVITARADRHAALPAWSLLTVRATAR